VSSAQGIWRRTIDKLTLAAGHKISCSLPPTPEPWEKPGHHLAHLWPLADQDAEVSGLLDETLRRFMMNVHYTTNINLSTTWQQLGSYYQHAKATWSTTTNMSEQHGQQLSTCKSNMVNMPKQHGQQLSTCQSNMVNNCQHLLMNKSFSICWTMCSSCSTQTSGEATPLILIHWPWACCRRWSEGSGCVGTQIRVLETMGWVPYRWSW